MLSTKYMTGREKEMTERAQTMPDMSFGPFVSVLFLPFMFFDTKCYICCIKGRGRLTEAGNDKNRPKQC
jgi:hypothetical protein